MTTVSPTPAMCETVRLGCVSYLNTLPLIEGIGKLDRARMTLTAPSRLIEMLLEGDIDVGLVSLIDYQRSPSPLAMMPVGVIACDGPTMTVRVYSRRPLHEIESVAADIDSHTAVALMRILLRETCGVTPRVEPREFTDAPTPGAERGDLPEAMLVIGDKVITNSPPAVLYPHQLDLGLAWKELTGLPFVYAVWMCHAGERDAPAVRLAMDLLDRQRRHNATRLGWIASQRGPLRGWPVDMARRYLCELLHFDVTDRDREAVDRFFDLAAAHGLIEARRPSLWA